MAHWTCHSHACLAAFAYLHRRLSSVRELLCARCLAICLLLHSCALLAFADWLCALCCAACALCSLCCAPYCRKHICAYVRLCLRNFVMTCMAIACVALYACLQTHSSGLCRYFGKLRLTITHVAGCVLLRIRRYGLRCLRLRNLDYVRLSCGVLLLICRKHPHLPDCL